MQCFCGLSARMFDNSTCSRQTPAPPDLVDVMPQRAVVNGLPRGGVHVLPAHRVPRRNVRAVQPRLRCPIRQRLRIARPSITGLLPPMQQPHESVEINLINQPTAPMCFNCNICESTLQKVTRLKVCDKIMKCGYRETFHARKTAMPISMFSKSSTAWQNSCCRSTVDLLI